MQQPTLKELRRKPHWSYSSINTFLNVCALQWAFSHVYHEPPLFTPVNLAFGGVFHRCLEYLTRFRQQGEAVDSGQVADLFSDLWLQESRIAEPPLHLDEGENADTLNARGRSMLAAYAASIDPAEKVLGVSVVFSAPLIDAAGEPLGKPLIGEIDCVVESDGKPLLTDWKTSARRWPESKVRLDLQPTCYLYAHQHNGGRPDTLFRFDVVTKAKSPAVERYLTIRSDTQFTRLVEIVKVIESMVRAEHFLPNDQGFACGDCPYSLACQAWHRERSRSLYNFRLAA